MTGMHFIGNDDPAELASYLKQLTQSEIRILPGGCMQPLKTVLFLADLAPDNAANKNLHRRAPAQTARILALTEKASYNTSRIGRIRIRRIL